MTGSPAGRGARAHHAMPTVTAPTARAMPSIPRPRPRGVTAPTWSMRTTLNQGPGSVKQALTAPRSDGDTPRPDERARPQELVVAPPVRRGPGTLLLV